MQPEQQPLLARLIERLQSRESLDLEYKAAKGGLPKSMWETVSAFANTNGGWILLGVSDEGEVEGVGDGHKLLKDFLDLTRNGGKVSHPVCGASDASVETIAGRDVVVIRVPAASRRNRPVYIVGNPYVGTFVRRGEGDYRCTKPEVDRMMREASDIAADSSVLTAHGIDDIDSESLAGFRRRYQTQHPASPNNGLDDIGFMRAIGAWDRNREISREGPTVAGLLMLGKADSIRSWRGRHLIDYRQLDEGEPEERWRDRVTWEGNLLGAVEAIFPRLIEGSEVPFRLAGAVRRDETPIQTALRESFVNLLAHADYAEPDASLILRSPHEFVFRNPGSSRVPEVDLYSGVRSDPRNPALIRMFRLIGLAEEAGTGIPSILNAWRSLGFRVPEIESRSERYEFKLRLRYVHMFSAEDRAWLNMLDPDLSEPEQVALVATLHDGETDNVTLRRLTGLHPADATKVLVGLRDRRILVMLGDRRGARYQLSEGALQDAASAMADEPGLDSPRPASESQPTFWPVASIDDSETSSGSSTPSLDSFASALDSFRDGLGSLASQFLLIAEPTRQKRHVDAGTRDAVIEALCAVTPLSIRELALITQRSEPTVKASVRALSRSSRLRLMYPAHPTHPAQRYLAPND
ncbi:MAG: putative DNA binding domain-containing protein [Chloroflexi bacterium]|nr:putative DNA binding domain-containing protein [Chloroflexota bacterium]